MPLRYSTQAQRQRVQVSQVEAEFWYDNSHGSCVCASVSVLETMENTSSKTTCVFSRNQQLETTARWPAPRVTPKARRAKPSHQRKKLSVCFISLSLPTDLSFRKPQSWKRNTAQERRYPVHLTTKILKLISVARLVSPPR